MIRAIQNIEICTTLIPMRTIEFDYEDKHFYVDMVLNEEMDSYEAYMYAKRFGIKLFMVGLLIHPEYKDETLTFERFSELIIANLEYHARDYIEEFMSDD